MLKLPSSLEKLIHEFSKLPGIGPKSAQRLALYLLKKDQFDLNLLSAAVADVKRSVTYCTTCHNMAETDPCNVCSNPNRNQNQICVVEDAMDALAIEKTGGFNGVYHVLGGALNPLEGIRPEDLHLDSLKSRVENMGEIEIIIATNPTLEGETTALHIAKLFTSIPVTITRLARGIPMGGDLEYTDEMTLSRALEGRRAL